MTLPVAALAEGQSRLHRFANDCEELARRSSCSPDARGRYHRAAADARMFARMRHLGEQGLRLALDCVTADARFAAWLNGDTPADSVERPIEREKPDGWHSPSQTAQTPLSESPRPPSGDMLNARQLAEAFGMSERGAHKAIVRGLDRGLPGFHCDGRRKYAERQAFASIVRAGSELVPIGEAGLDRQHDSTDHR